MIPDVRIIFTILAVLLAQLPATVHPRTASPIFSLYTNDVWLNAHHFLYVLGRARNHAADATRDAVILAPKDEDAALASLSPADRRIWSDAVDFYARTLSRKDLIFDRDLAAMTSTLAAVADANSLHGQSIDSATMRVLESAMPVYRATWWSAHRAANRARRDSVQAYLDRYGNAVQVFVTAAWRQPWPPGGQPVHIATYANWAGAYSTTTSRLIVVASLDTAAHGSLCLESVFHEAMHQWDDSITSHLERAAARVGKRVPANLSHAMIFYTAGEAVRSVIPGHVPMADALGIWERGFAAFRGPLDRIWKPYLHGNGTLDDTLASLLTDVGTR